MHYKPLAELLKTLDTSIVSEGLQKPLRGSGKLEAGWHSVVVGGVDLARLGDLGRMQLILESDSGNHRESVFLMNRASSDLSFVFRKLLEGFFGDSGEALKIYIGLLKSYQTDALQVLRGMKIDVEIKPGPGYTLQESGGAYEVRDAETGQLVVPGSFVSLGEARARAEGAGYKRSFNRVSNVQATNADYNIEALRNAEKAIVSTPESESSL